MTEVHSCSYYCDRPECIKAQRDELRDRLGSMTDREIMQQALEALEANSLLVNGDDKEGGLVWCMDGYYSSCFDIDPINKQTNEVITALRERLAQPEQEPLQFKCTVIDDAHPNGVPLEQWGKQPEQEPVTLPCCGYADASAVKWNPYSKAVQCHNCGQTYTPLAQPEQEHWDAIPDAFNKWWDADYYDTGNPFRKNSPAYWAWAGWKAASKQPEQEPVAKVELMLTGGAAGLATRIVEIDDHLRERLRPGQLLYTGPPQRKPLTDEAIAQIAAQGHQRWLEFARAIEAAHGIKGGA